MGNQQILRIVLSLAILAAFFLPISSTSLPGSLKISAWEVLSESFQNMDKLGNLPAESYVLISAFFVMLVVAVCLLLISLLRKPLTPVLTFIPFLIMIALMIFTFSQSQVSASETVQIFGSGFYIMMIASFLLLFTNISEKDMATTA